MRRKKIKDKNLEPPVGKVDEVFKETLDEKKDEEPTGKPSSRKRIWFIANWIPVLRKKRLYIEGDIQDFKAKNPNHYKKRWITSKIVRRISEQRVATKKSCYVLEGQLAIRPPQEQDDGPIPLFVIDKFKVRSKFWHHCLCYQFYQGYSAALPQNFPCNA